MAENNGWTLGDTSRRYETGGRGPGTISTGRGDKGGVSYGSYQISSEEGTLREYLGQSPYREQFAGLTPNTPEFKEKWRELARTDPGFAQDQHDFIKRTHYDPQAQTLKNRGLDLSDRGPAVQDALWSTSVQFRGLTPDIFEKGLKEKFGDNYDLSKLSDKDIVEAVQDYKINHNDRLFRSSPELWDSLKDRARNEKADLVQLAERNPVQAADQPTPPGRPTQPPQSGQTAPDTAGQAPPASSPPGTRSSSQSPSEVRELQNRLNQLGYTDAQGRPLASDGIVGPKTEAAIKAFQREHGLDADGIAGPLTREALKTAQPRQGAATPSAPANGPLLSDPSHPDHGMYKQAFKAIEKLGADAGFKDTAEIGRAAAALTYEAKVSGLKEINHVVPNASGTGLFAVQGALNDPSHQRVYVDKAQAQQSVEKSTEQLSQDMPKNVPTQTTTTERQPDKPIMV